MDYSREFAALADLALSADLLTVEQVALLNRKGTRKAMYTKRHLLDLMAHLREKINQMSNADVDSNPLSQYVIETIDAIEESWNHAGHKS